MSLVSPLMPVPYYLIADLLNFPQQSPSLFSFLCFHLLTYWFIVLDFHKPLHICNHSLLAL